jgi:hypothetical protein
MVLLHPKLGTFARAEAAARATKRPRFDSQAFGRGNHGAGGCKSAGKGKMGPTFIVTFEGWRVEVHITYSLSSHSFCMAVEELSRALQ